MSRRLYLLRHAKSSWDDPELDDHDRPLAPRGRRAAEAIARHLREQGIAPDLVLCSTSRRARETVEVIDLPSVRHEPELYGASAEALLERLRRVPDAVGTVMIVGHNPAMERLALDVTRPSALRSEIEVKFPTAALATIALPEAGWQSLAHGAGDVIAFVRPRELAG